MLVATDGDSVRRGMLHEMTSDPLAPVVQSLAELVMMHPLRSEGSWAESMDQKHNAKRIRTRLYSEMGVLIAPDGLSLNKHSLLRLFNMWSPGTDFTRLFDVQDKCVIFCMCLHVLPFRYDVQPHTTVLPI